MYKQFEQQELTQWKLLSHLVWICTGMQMHKLEAFVSDNDLKKKSTCMQVQYLIVLNITKG